ncbi:MAG: PAS domain S-box protein, partial [Spirochaetota bacterium]
EQAADGIFITDAQGNYTEVNAAATSMLGYSRTELLGMNVRDLILPSDLKRQEVHFKELHRGNTLVTKRTLVRKDGSHLFTEINAKSLSDGRMMGIVRDVSERRWQDLILATRARIAEAVLGVSETDLLRMTIDVAEEVTDSRIGFFHYVDEKQGSLSLQMWSTNTEAGMCGAQASGGHYAVAVAGVWVDCIHERKPVIHNDYASLAGRKGLPVGHAPIIRELLVPIIRNDMIVAIIGVGNKPREYGLEDINRISMLADLTWDVLEKREAERRLRESEERFSTIFHESPLATSLTRLETGEFVDLNHAALQLFGYDRREEMIGRTVADLALYEEPEVRGRFIASLRDDGSSARIETRLRRKSGELFDASMVVEIIHIGREPYLVIQTQDFTERNRAERELRESESSLRLSQAVAHVGNWTWDTRTNRVQWSEGMYRVFGLDKADFDPNLDSIVERCIHPDDRQRVIESNRAVMEEAHPAEIEYRVVWSDGSVHDIWAMPGASTHGKDGSIVILTGIVQDITERKRSEESIRRTLAEKEVLLRELYHRSNNNMQVITALLEFQAAEIADERLTRAISDTQDRISSIALVNRKLYEARDLSHIDLREYIEELARILSQSYLRRDGQITFVPDLEEVRVLIDTAIPCGLILNELISNVFKHAYPDGGIGDIIITLRKLSDGTITLRVADHGVGVPEGFDFMRDGHIGLQSIVGLCANQLRGQVLFDTKNGLACEIS